MSVVWFPRRQRLLGYMVLQPVASCQTGYPAAHTSSDEEDGHAQGPLMSVPMDPYGPRRKHLVTMSADAHLSHPLGVYVNAQRGCLSQHTCRCGVSQAASTL